MAASSVKSADIGAFADAITSVTNNNPRLAARLAAAHRGFEPPTNTVGQLYTQLTTAWLTKEASFSLMLIFRFGTATEAVRLSKVYPEEINMTCGTFKKGYSVMEEDYIEKPETLENQEALVAKLKELVTKMKSAGAGAEYNWVFKWRSYSRIPEGSVSIIRYTWRKNGPAVWIEKDHAPSSPRLALEDVRFIRDKVVDPTPQGVYDHFNARFDVAQQLAMYIWTRISEPDAKFVGGAFKKTNQKIRLKDGRIRCVHLDPKGKRFVKVDGQIVHV